MNDKKRITNSAKSRQEFTDVFDKGQEVEVLRTVSEDALKKRSDLRQEFFETFDCLLESDCEESIMAEIEKIMGKPTVALEILEKQRECINDILALKPITRKYNAISDDLEKTVEDLMCKRWGEYKQLSDQLKELENQLN